MGSHATRYLFHYRANGILKTSAWFVEGFNAFGNQLANLKTINALPESEINLFRTHVSPILVIAS